MRWIQRTLGIAYAAIVCGSTALQAQHRSPSLGTDAVQAVAISTSDIEAAGGGITWAQNATFYRYLTRGVLNLIAALSAPQASLLTALDPEACDVMKRITPSSRALTPVIPSALRRHPERSEPATRGKPPAVGNAGRRPAVSIPSPAGPEPCDRFRDPSALWARDDRYASVLEASAARNPRPDASRMPWILSSARRPADFGIPRYRSG